MSPLRCARSIRRFWRSRSGVASVELALYTPVLFALMFTAFEGGNYMLTQHRVTKAVREGARYAARLPFSNYACPAPADGQITDAATTTRIKNLTRTGQLSGGKPRIRGWADTNVSVTYSCSDDLDTGLYKTSATAPRVMVSALVPYPSILGALGFATNDSVVRSQSQAAVVGI